MSLSEKELFQLQCGREVNSAVKWWTSNFREVVPHQKVEKFQLFLSSMLYSKLRNHWYPDEPGRGSGFRAIIHDFHIDPLLKRACELSDIEPCLLPGRCVQVINPGNVKIRSLTNDNMEQIVFSGKPITL